MRLVCSSSFHVQTKNLVIPWRIKNSKRISYSKEILLYLIKTMYPGMAAKEKMKLQINDNIKK